MQLLGINTQSRQSPSIYELGDGGAHITMDMVTRMGVTDDASSGVSSKSPSTKGDVKLAAIPNTIKEEKGPNEDLIPHRSMEVIKEEKDEDDEETTLLQQEGPGESSGSDKKAEKVDGYTAAFAEVMAGKESKESPAENMRVSDNNSRLLSSLRVSNIGSPTCDASHTSSLLIMPSYSVRESSLAFRQDRLHSHGSRSTPPLIRFASSPSPPRLCRTLSKDR